MVNVKKYARMQTLRAVSVFKEDLLEYVTVMACIAVRGRPRFGVIYRPFSRQTIWGYDKYGVFPNGSVLDASSSPPNVIVVSRSHPGQVESFAKAAFNSQYSVEPVGGAGYKVLRVLNGTAAIYLHKTVVKKWDLCAGDSIIRVAGGKMLTLLGNQLSYFPDDPQVINSEGLLVTMKDTFNVLDKIKSHLAG